MSEIKLLFLAFYVPEDHVEKVLNAIFNAGAGKYKAYDHCAWTTRGEGRFRPLKGSSPFTGKEQMDTRVPEIKVECILTEKRREKVENALLKAHPYEEPAYHFMSLCHA
ncbi:MAG: NGG1p interacting factor NIF3 [Candidatus Marinimicrobia bacterium]|nr:NGG1p interacting factor NIF3 [Candidatus Neomarinimicrobiota bacterium]